MDEIERLLAFPGFTEPDPDREPASAYPGYVRNGPSTLQLRCGLSAHRIHGGEGARN
jgi:hypothetical protein